MPAIALKRKDIQVFTDVELIANVIGGREDGFEELVRRYQDQEVPRPEYWGGFRVLPHTIEFWQGGDHRLHDRLRFSLLPDATWRRERLAP